MPVGRVFVDWVVRGDCDGHISPQACGRRSALLVRSKASAFSYIQRYECEITIAVTILNGHSTQSCSRTPRRAVGAAVELPS